MWHMEVGGDPLAATYLWYGISVGTRQSYESAVRGFVTFCRMSSWAAPYIPTTPSRVEAWIADEARRSGGRGGLSKKTLKRKVSALSSWHTDLGANLHDIITPRLERIISGANRYHGIATRPQPLPITLPILVKITQVIRRSPQAFGGPHTSKALVAAFTLAFACFMRLGEITYDAFDPRFDLRRGSLDHRDDVRLTIPASKMDPFRSGVTVVVPEGPADICPRRALRDWLATYPDIPSLPLFHLGGGPFNRRSVTRYLDKALTDAGYVSGLFSGHSFRRGAATWAASIGFPALDIKTLGRWNSDAYKLYVDAGPRRSAEIGKMLLSTGQQNSSLPPSGIPTPGDIWRPSI